MADVMEELKGINRDVLMERMSSALPMICGEMGESLGGISTRTGLDQGRLKHIASGKRRMKWSEYLSILFVLWNDKKGRRIVDENGFFPQELKAAMAINRNDHGQVNDGI